MAKIIAFCNQKGGTGKTTTAVNVAAYLVALSKKVLLVDADPQANATSGVGIDPQKLESHLYHGLAHSRHADELIKTTPLLNLHVLPAHPELAGATIDLLRVKNREYRLRDLLKPVRRRYDYIIIDPPPSLDLLTINALTASDGVIIPIQCEYYALEGLSQLMNTINLVKDNLNTSLEIEGVVMTMADFRTKLTQEVIDEVESGTDFDDVVKRFSEDREGVTGGLYTTAITDRLPLGKLAFSLMPGQIYGPIRKGKQYSIFQLVPIVQSFYEFYSLAHYYLHAGWGSAGPCACSASGITCRPPWPGCE